MTSPSALTGLPFFLLGYQEGVIPPITYTLAVFLLLSLLAAYVLFRVLKSTAFIQSSTHKAGGAVAGFVIVYGALFGSYYKLKGLEVDKYKRELANVESRYKLLSNTQPIEGTVGPEGSQVTFILAVDNQGADSQGHFQLKAPCSLDPSSSHVSVYAVSQGGKVFTQRGESWLLLANFRNIDEMKRFKPAFTLEPKP